MKIIFLSLTLLWLGLLSGAWGKTVTTANGSNTAVQAAIDSASSGDTVQIPAGSHTWTGSITCNKAITIDGSGCTITDGAGSSDLLKLTLSSVGHLTIANINFKPGTATGRYMNIGGSAGAKGIILHDLTFNHPNFQLNTAITANMLGGLIYNCTFESTDNPSGQGPGSGSECLQIRSPKGWYDADTFGTQDTNGDQNLYIEDCIFRDIYNAAIDLDDNARIVLRHSEMINSQIVTHGITSMWGGRFLEAYNCAFKYEKRNGVWVNMNRFWWARGGTGRIHDNSVDRIDSGGYWGGAKPSWVFIDEPLTRQGSGNGGRCETQSQYPGTRWPGTGTSGKAHPTGQVVSPSPVDPVYVWDNSGNGATFWGTNDQSGDTQSCDNGPTSAVFKLDRDIKLAEAPGYTPYPYPHPWRGGQPVGTPTPTPQPTATASPSATPTPEVTPTYEHWMEEQNNWIRSHPPVPDL